ncbi:hypothetical protein [Robertkochia solimangrovi]
MMKEFRKVSVEESKKNKK